MSNYKRIYKPGGTFFFTLVTYKRQPVFADELNVKSLRYAFTKVKTARQFHIDAIVVLPDHLHCILRLPENDWDYSSRWREIKKTTTKEINKQSDQKNKRSIWQRRFWEHTIRDENDWRQHMDYIHYNPVKHKLVACPLDWKWTSFHRLVERGWYKEDWGSTVPDTISGMEFE